MINLIPNIEKKDMAKGFYFRLLVLFLVTISISILIFFISILPSYFLSTVKNNVINEKLGKQKSEPVSLPDAETLAIIKDLDNKLQVVENSGNNKFFISANILNPIFIRKSSNIKITQISYINDLAAGKKLSIRGTAFSREILLSFREALEDDSAFKSVDLPISNFVKGSNIQFYLDLIPA